MRNRNVVLGIFILLWVSGLIGLGRLNLQAVLKTHRILKTNTFTVTAPGIAAIDFNDSLVSAAPTLRLVRAFTYLVRYRLQMIPLWISSAASLNDEKDFDQLILREEIASEFIGASSASNYAKAADVIHANTLQLGEAQHPIVVLMPPTKIAANQLVANADDLGITESQILGLTNESPRRGGMQQQLEFENALEQIGVSVLSPIQAYKNLQKTQRLLYPRAESHWTSELVTYLVPELLKQLSTRELFESRCLDNGYSLLQISHDEIPYLGDLYLTGLGWPQDSPYKGRFESKIHNVTSTPREIAQDPTCPMLTVVGSSYSNSKIGGMTFPEILQTFYKGTVSNLSVDGSYPTESLNVAKSKLAPGAIVIWEFPFRQVKFFARGGRS